jgi:hypothetical protein
MDKPAFLATLRKKKNYLTNNVCVGKENKPAFLATLRIQGTNSRLQVHREREREREKG